MSELLGIEMIKVNYHNNEEFHNIVSYMTNEILKGENIKVNSDTKSMIVSNP